MTSSILDGEKEKTLNVEDVFDALEEKRDRGDRRIVERLVPHSFVFSVLKAITREKSVLSNFARRLKMFFWYLHLLVHVAYGFVAKRERVPLSGTHVNNSIAETTSKARTRPTRAKGTFKEEEKVSIVSGLEVLSLTSSRSEALIFFSVVKSVVLREVPAE